MRKGIILLYWEELNSSERCVVKIAEFLGLTIELAGLDDELVKHPNWMEFRIPRGGCVIIGAQTLLRLGRLDHASPASLQSLVSLAVELIVFGFEPSPDQNEMVRILTAGKLLGVEALPESNAPFIVDDEARLICRHFAGLSFGAANRDTDFTFKQGGREMDSSALIRIGSAPFFVCAEVRGCRLLLIACREVADLDERVPRSSALLLFFSRLVPLMMSLKSAAGDQSWHNDIPRACFIVDDPLLTERYGFLDFRKLLEVMERDLFSTSIAFIPWNHRRSDRRVIELFRAYPRRYSLCVHGCDHTAKEFGTTDYKLLQAKAQQALDRMVLHERLSGLAFDEVMVFPQGIFARVAMKALGARDYLAAVNSTPYPIDGSDNPITLRDLLDVAVTSFSNCPLFIRRYPSDLAHIAFDLFLGKPALLVEHHSYFRDNYRGVAEIVKKLYSVEKHLKWTSLGQICSTSSLKRVADNGNIHVRFYCDRFHLQNKTSRSQNYILFRRQLPQWPLTGLSINGSPALYGQEADYLKIPLSLEAGQTAEVCIMRGSHDPVTKCHMRRGLDRARVFLRRRLCEFRDNYVQANSLLRAITAHWQGKAW